jgi:hypothetical protein
LQSLLGGFLGGGGLGGNQQDKGGGSSLGGMVGDILGGSPSNLLYTFICCPKIALNNFVILGISPNPQQVDNHFGNLPITGIWTSLTTQNGTEVLAT